MNNIPFASSEDLIHLRYVITGSSMNHFITSDDASFFYRLLAPHWNAAPFPADIRAYANGKKPMPMNIYSKLLEVRLVCAD